ncbi:MAG: alpha/beta hydrolase, partial [Pseudomonadota bacterium]
MKTILLIASAVIALWPAVPGVFAQERIQKKGGERPPAAPAAWAEPLAEPDGMKYRTFPSQAAGAEVSYLIYLPPDYETAKTQRYPVVYWLHGIGGSQQGVPGITARLTSAIVAGKTPPFLMVFVNGMIRSSYVDSADGKIPVETVTIKELIPHVDSTYRTVATRAGRMIEGFSMGGGGAAKWGFKHPDLFGSISIVDGALHGSGDTSDRATDTLERVYGGDKERFAANDPWKLAEKNADAVRGRTTIRVLTGSRMLTGTNTKYHELLDSLKLAHDFDVIADAAHSPSPMYEGLGDKN